MEIKTLNNPPIREALLEIRFNPNKNVTVDKLKEFADSLSDVYTNVEPVENQSFAFMYSKEEGPKHDFNIEPSGFKMTNAQNNRILIATIDKLIVSFLAPYTPWPDLKDTTKTIYTKYLECVPQTEVTRLGMRYINDIKLPLKQDFSFQKYINTFQPLPKYKGLPNSVAKFETTLVIPLEDIGSISTVRQILLGPEDGSSGNPEYLKFVLDIDVYKEKVIKSIRNDEIWNSFEEMRVKKNAIFFGTLTDAAITPYD